MRLLQVLVPTAKRAQVEDALTDLGAEYLVVDEVRRTDAVVMYVPAPTGAVETVRERLREVGLGDDTYIVVTDAQSVSGVDTGELEALVAGPKGERGVSHARLRERADDLWPDGLTYVALAFLSALVAVAGLLLDSAIVIVGAMVIAPFAGSTLSASAGAVIGDHDMVVRSARAQIVGLFVGLLGALAVAFGIQQTGFVPESLAISQAQQVGFFLTPSLLALAIAICAGAAGALALATDLPVAIAGVAVAAAIIPAVATTAIGVVWGLPLMAVGSVVLLLLNIVFLNLTAYVALVALGYRSSMFRDALTESGLSVRTGGYALLVAVFFLVAVVTVGASAQHIAFEHGAATAVSDTLGDEQYDALELRDVAVSYDDAGLFGEPETVTVTLGRTDGGDYTGLARSLQSTIADRTDNPVTVRIQFVDYETAEASASGDVVSSQKYDVREHVSFAVA
ncbi:DUF389 domain-containing protein [Halomarina oriensis]|uniref:DUF389 domain-containing protein n=1 Tax=Halomarina oriensis TaxID=671145 RepID=A0A6B0GXC8_9EURY|nr:DUF389 domain-containing protein [Halomarina oriensis]MWG36795.1 DUF389 domain-containing protein [Halomarina oriensis]